MYIFIFVIGVFYVQSSQKKPQSSFDFQYNQEIAAFNEKTSLIANRLWLLAYS